MSGRHLARARLASLAGGAAPTRQEAFHLLACPACREVLGGVAPDALLAPLGSLPPVQPAPPLPALPARRPARFTRGLLAAAAVLLAALLGLFRTGGDRRGPAWDPAPGSLVATVEAPGARVVTFVPRNPDDPVVTLVLDQEIDL